MRVLIAAQYYAPEDIGAAIWITQLARDLTAYGHAVTVLTAFPNYPERRVFEQYRGSLYCHEVIDGVEVIRSWIYANPCNAAWSRLANWGSYCASSLASGLLQTVRPDVIYAILPPLPLGMTMSWLAQAKDVPLVTNVQDIYPLVAVQMGALRSATWIRFFERMEHRVYARSTGIVVISPGFRDNLLSRGAAKERIAVVPNWVDANGILPGPRDNAFRRSLGAGTRFVLIYSGGLTNNSNVDALIQAMAHLRDDRVLLTVVGGGVRAEALKQLAGNLALTNVSFLPFQPLAVYPDVLRAADITVVTLHHGAAVASAPSKVYKQMAAGRPILAISPPGTELDRLIAEAKCGFRVDGDDPKAIANVIRHAACNPALMAEMGTNARRYVVDNHDRQRCTKEIEQILAGCAGGNPACR